jgi:elongation factor Ts
LRATKWRGNPVKVAIFLGLLRRFAPRNDNVDKNMLELIKELREKTGAGMTACKKALDETGGDMEKAVEYLRKQGIAKAAKRGDRETSEGIIKLAVSSDNKEAYIMKLVSETDFVARNEKFLTLADQVLELIKDKKPADLGELHSLAMDGVTVKEVIDNLSGTIGEKMAVKDFAVLKSEGTVAAYSHLGGKIGVLVSLDKSEHEELAVDMAMQIAAANPRYLSPDEVPAGETDKEKEIYKEQLIKEGKPENIIEKIMEGKINKYFEEVCLLNQEYIKDDKKKVKDILGNVKVEKFVRYSLS